MGSPIVILSRFQTPAPNKALQPKRLQNPHETVGVLDDNLLRFPGSLSNANLPLKFGNGTRLLQNEEKFAIHCVFRNTCATLHRPVACLGATRSQSGHGNRKPSLAP
jgi:hypothetical protein